MQFYKYLSKTFTLHIACLHVHRDFTRDPGKLSMTMSITLIISRANNLNFVVLLFVV